MISNLIFVLKVVPVGNILVGRCGSNCKRAIRAGLRKSEWIVVRSRKNILQKDYRIVREITENKRATAGVLTVKEGQNKNYVSLTDVKLWFRSSQRRRRGPIVLIPKARPGCLHEQLPTCISKLTVKPTSSTHRLGFRALSDVESTDHRLSSYYNPRFCSRLCSCKPVITHAPSFWNSINPLAVRSDTNKKANNLCVIGPDERKWMKAEKGKFLRIADHQEVLDDIGGVI